MSEVPDTSLGLLGIPWSADVYELTRWRYGVAPIHFIPAASTYTFPLTFYTDLVLNVSWAKEVMYRLLGTEAGRDAEITASAQLYQATGATEPDGYEETLWTAIGTGTDLPTANGAPRLREIDQDVISGYSWVQPVIVVQSGTWTTPISLMVEIWCNANRYQEAANPAWSGVDWHQMDSTKGDLLQDLKTIRGFSW